MDSNSSISDFSESLLPITVNSARCTSETLGDETLVIDTVSGTLYVLRGLGATIWVALTNGSGRPVSLVEQAAERFGSEVGDALSVMLEILSPLFLLADEETISVEWPETAVPPIVERFDDIADILTLDPIHDVQPDAGWPFESESGPS